MSRQVNLPPGCKSLRMEDGTRYVAGRAGGQVTVSDHHGAAINRLGGNGTAGLINGNPGLFVRSKKGRRCAACNRVWMPWVEHCHRCGRDTEPE
jgi:hypothetical protein